MNNNIKTFMQVELQQEHQKKKYKKSKKEKRKWRQGKSETKPKGETYESTNAERKAEQYMETLNKLEIIGDPFDSMNLDTKKKHAISCYYSLLKVK